MMYLCRQPAVTREPPGWVVLQRSGSSACGPENMCKRRMMRRVVLQCCSARFMTECELSICRRCLPCDVMDLGRLRLLERRDRAGLLLPERRRSLIGLRLRLPDRLSRRRAEMSRLPAPFPPGP